jgi:SPP1 family predicted phage head-tail adaptor
MEAGKLNRRVSLQQIAETRDAAGQVVASGWTEVARPWANIRYLNGKEYATSGTVVSSATASVRIRYRRDITASMRVVYRDTVFNILAVLPDEVGHEYIDLACNTGVRAG